MATVAALKAVHAILKPKKKGKNFYDIAFRHADFGANRIYTRNTLKKYSKDPNNIDSFWYVTKVEEGVRVGIRADNYLKLSYLFETVSFSNLVIS